MKLSVIMPVYNVEEYLSQSIESVLSQDTDDIEIICIDDCSNDNSYNILLKYAAQDSRIKVFKNEQNIGVGCTRNKGLNHAAGEYIHFVDPDDWLEKDAYQSIIEKLNNNKNLDILFINYKRYDNETKEFRKIEFPNKDILDKVLNPVKDVEAFDNWERMCWLKIFRKNFLIDNNIYFPDYVSLSDVEWSAKTYVKAKSLYYTNICAINYRFGQKTSLVAKSLNSIKNIFKSFVNNKKLYNFLSEPLKYKLLGFDYFLLTTGIPEAYAKKIINIIDLYKMIKLINDDKNLSKYIFNFRSDYVSLENFRYPILNFWKVLVKTHCPKLFNLIIKIKKTNLFDFIQKS